MTSNSSKIYRHKYSFLHILFAYYLGCAIIQLPEVLLFLFKFIKSKILSKSRLPAFSINNEWMSQIEPKNTSSKLTLDREKSLKVSNANINNYPEKIRSIEATIMNLTKEIIFIRERIDQTDPKLDC